MWRRRPKDFWRFFREEHDLVNGFPSKEHISDKSKNMRAIKKFYHTTGCSYLELHPASHSMRHYGDCLAFMDDLAASYTGQPEILWFLKNPNGCRGEGIRVLPTSQVFTEFGITTADLMDSTSRINACKRTTSSLHIDMIQKEVYPPLLIHGSTFHVRTYLLVVSTNPYVVLFRNGFVLRNLHRYATYEEGKTEIRTTEGGKKTLPLENYITHTTFQKSHPDYSYPNHWWQFDKLREYFGEEKYSNLLVSLKKMATTLTDVIQSQNPKQKGFYFFLSVDCIVRDDLTPQLLEMNTIPYLGILPEVWKTRQQEDFKVVNEILHIMYKYHSEIKTGDSSDVASLALSKDWELLRNNHADPEYRFELCRDCSKKPKNSEGTREEL